MHACLRPALAARRRRYDRDTLRFQVLSIQHQRLFFEANIGPISRLVEALSVSDPQKLASFRRELEELCALYFEDNHLQQGFLLTRAVKL